MADTIWKYCFFSIPCGFFLTYFLGCGQMENMNGTSVVGYIALLMICGSVLGNGGRDLSAIRADAMSASGFSTLAKAEPTASLSVAERGPKESRYVRVIIDGIPYEGTLHANPTANNITY